jgi:hypothetical protein
MRTLRYTNPNGLTLELGGAAYPITKLEGIDSLEWDGIESRAPLQDGSSDLGGSFQTRDITVEGAMATLAQNMAGIYAARRTLTLALNPKDGPGTLDLTTDTGTWRITARPVTSPAFAPKEANDPYQRFQIVFHCADPHWVDVDITTETLSETGTGFAIPEEGFAILNEGFAVETVSTINGQSIILENSGDVECPILIRFYGEVTNPKILNKTTGEYIRIVKAIALGDYIEVNTAFGAKTVEISESGTVTNASMYLDLLSTFFQLAVGNNEIEFTDESSATGSSAVLTYRNRYIGV